MKEGAPSAHTEQLCRCFAVRQTHLVMQKGFVGASRFVTQRSKRRRLSGQDPVILIMLLHQGYSKVNLPSLGAP